MNCPGKYKFKNSRANKWEDLECGIKYSCKLYTPYTRRQGKPPISKKRDCEHYETPYTIGWPAIKNKQQ